ncbi:MAG: type II secretion system F family protein [Gemmatimonadetes bacterium]|nr:type II secretion system F family protein [Gemmatimonadota bacterium]
MADSVALAAFTRQLATAVGSGLPLVQALTLLGKEGSGRELGDVVSAVTADLAGGTDLSSALGQHPDTFSNLYVEVVAAGEATGQLDTMLLALANMLEKHRATALRVKSVLIYPGFLLAFTALTAIVTAPGVAQKLAVATAIVVAIGFGMRRMRQRSAVPQHDIVPLWTPVFGTVYKKSVLARVTRTLGLAVSAGIPLVDALGIAARVSGSRTIYRAIMRSRGLILRGETLEAALKGANAFPPMVVAMAATGEQTGHIGEMLTKIAEYYEQDVDMAVKAAISVMQHASIVIAAGLVLILVLGRL